MIPLTLAEIERLTLIAEEAAEVVQAATKVLRHGWKSTHPSCPGVNNRQNLMKELGDLRAAVQLCFQANDMNSVDYQFYALDKLDRVRKYLHCGENISLAEAALDQHNSPGGS